MNREALSLQLEDHLRSERTTAATGFYFTQVAPPGGHGPAVDAVYFSASSRSDAAATVDVFLLAADRADWLAQQRTPTPESWVSYATRCWIVAASPSIAVVDDVPSGWGLLVAEPLNTEHLFTVVKRPRSRRAVIEAPLLLALLANQHASHVQRIAGIRSQSKRHASGLSLEPLHGPAATPSTRGSGPQDADPQPLNGTPRDGSLSAGPQGPGCGQLSPRAPHTTAVGSRTAQVLPA